jgi:hypothetical protein
VAVYDSLPQKHLRRSSSSSLLQKVTRRQCVAHVTCDPNLFGPLRTTIVSVWVMSKGPNFPKPLEEIGLGRDKFGPQPTQRCGPNPNSTGSRLIFRMKFFVISPPRGKAGWSTQGRCAAAGGRLTSGDAGRFREVRRKSHVANPRLAKPVGARPSAIPSVRR